MTETRTTPTVAIWDLPLRLFHWLLAAAVLGSWITHQLGASAFTWHVWFGYCTLVLVSFRLLWGFFGPRHARFSSFVRGPRAAWAYARGLFHDDGPTYPGHNPLGGWMTLLLLALLLAQGSSGLFANDEITDTGPLYGHVSDATSDWLTGWHHRLANVLWVAIGMHVAAVLAYLLIKKDNLIGAMVSGRKHGAHMGAEAGIRGSRIWLAVVLAAACAGLLYWVVSTAPAGSMEMFF